jgi:predicted nucleic acid-binding protein
MGRARSERGGGASTTAVVLDTGALVALDKNDRRLIALLVAAREMGVRLLIPATVLAQAWGGGGRQVRLATLVADEKTEVPPLNRAWAESVGALCAQHGTKDIVDAHVALIALYGRAKVLTSDPDDLRRLAPNLSIERI